MSYPKWLYHKTKAPIVVHTEVEHESFKDGWEETPAAFDKEQDASGSESTTSQDQETDSTGNEKKELIGLNLVAMKVAELRDILISKGKTKEELKGLQKDELIALIGSL